MFSQVFAKRKEGKYYGFVSTSVTISISHWYCRLLYLTEEALTTCGFYPLSQGFGDPEMLS